METTESPTIQTLTPKKKVLLFTLILLILPISFLISYLSCNKQITNTKTPDTNTPETSTTFIPKDGTGTLSKIRIDEDNNEYALLFTDSKTKEEKTLELDMNSYSDLLIGKYYYQIKDFTHVSRIDLFSGEKEVFELEMNPNFVIVDYYVRDNVIYYLSGIEYCTWYCAETWCSCPSIDLQAYNIYTDKVEVLTKDMTVSPSNTIDGFDSDGNLIFSYKWGDAGEMMANIRKYDFGEKKVIEIGNVDSWCDPGTEEEECEDSGSLSSDYTDEIITTVTYVKSILFENGKIVVSSLEQSNEELESEFIRVGTSTNDLQYYYPLWNE